MSSVINCSIYVISIHAPPRGATGKARVTDSAWVFQFTPLREGRLCQHQIAIKRSDFNSRPSARGDASNLRDTLIALYFNSRPSARGDLSRDLSLSYHKISIHAPPRGATNDFATLNVVTKFQFTPLREGRRMRLRRGWGDDNISIHAPPRGATFLVQHYIRIT